MKTAEKLNNFAAIADLPGEIKLTFHKGGGKKKNSVVIESDRQKLVFKAWEHKIIPHEMVHYAVESVFGELKGFIKLIGEGATEEEIEGRKAGLSASYIEYLVGAFQYELWGMSSSDDQIFLQNFQNFKDEGKKIFSADEYFEFVPDLKRIETCRRLLQNLTDEWNILPPGEELKYTLRR